MALIVQDIAAPHPGLARPQHDTISIGKLCFQGECDIDRPNRQTKVNSVPKGRIQNQLVPIFFKAVGLQPEPAFLTGQIADSDLPPILLMSMLFVSAVLM